MIAWAECLYLGPLRKKWIGPGLDFLKMLPNNRKIQSGEEGSNGLDRSYGKSRYNSTEMSKRKKWIFIGAVLLVSLIGLLIYLSIPSVDEPEKNFDYLWTSFDRNYSNFECKDIDWKTLYNRYRSVVTPETNNRELFKIMVDLLEHLDDKHVYIHKFNNVFFSGYDLPILGYSQVLKFDFRLPLNDFSLKLIEEKHIQGKFKKAFFVCQLNVPPFGLRHVFHYGWLDHDIAYIHISEMRKDKRKTEKAVNEILKYFNNAKAYIIDIRDNIGGYAVPIKESLCRKFVDRERVWAISYKRSGPKHTDFSEPEHWSNKPDGRIDLSQKPVVLLTNKNTQSAAELFTLMMGVLPNVTVVGDKTMGIFSDTEVDKLPNGWEFRLSYRKTTNHEGIWLEGKGITPDVLVKNTEMDIKGGKDKVLEKAIELILH